MEQDKHFHVKFVNAIKSGVIDNVKVLITGKCRDEISKIVNKKYKLEHKEYLTPLLMTIKFHKYEMFRYLIHEHEVDIERNGTVILNHINKFSSGERYTQSKVTPLWYAAAKPCHHATRKCFARLLVECGANVNSISENQSTPLHMACYSLNLPLVEYLLQNGANPNSYNNTETSTPLLCVVPLGATYKSASLTFNFYPSDIVELVTTLIAHGADVNSKTRYGQTLLHYAAESNDIELAKLLIQNGAKFTKDKQGLTPMHSAGLCQNENFVSYFENEPFVSKQDKIESFELLATKCFSNDQEKDCYDFFKKALKYRHSYRKDVLQKKTLPPRECYGNHKECTSLDELKHIKYNHRALQYQCLFTLERLLGNQSIHFAVGLFEVGEDAIEEGGFNGPDGVKMMKEALEILCLKQKVATYLLPAYLDVHMMYHLNGNEDAIACQEHSQEDMMEMIHLCVVLLQHAVENPHRLAAGRTLLWAEVMNIYRAAIDAMSLLLSHSKGGLCVLNQHSWKQQIKNFVQLSDKLVKQELAEVSFLQWLLTMDHNDTCELEIILLVVECGSDVNLYSFHGETALHMISKQKYFLLSEVKLIMQSFLSHGAHVDIVNANGETPLDLSIKFNGDEAEEKTQVYKHVLSSYISLKCLAAKVVKENCYNHENNGLLPKMLKEFVDLH